MIADSEFNSEQPATDRAIESLDRLDETLGEIEDRMEQMQTAREWLAKTLFTVSSQLRPRA